MVGIIIISRFNFADDFQIGETRTTVSVTRNRQDMCSRILSNNSCIISCVRFKELASASAALSDRELSSSVVHDIVFLLSTACTNPRGRGCTELASCR
jgi:hypothetical protein